jgi:hypothetical protein
MNPAMDDWAINDVSVLPDGQIIKAPKSDRCRKCDVGFKAVNPAEGWALYCDGLNANPTMNAEFTLVCMRGAGEMDVDHHRSEVVLGKLIQASSKVKMRGVTKEQWYGRYGYHLGSPNLTASAVPGRAGFRNPDDQKRNRAKPMNSEKYLF